MRATPEMAGPILSRAMREERSLGSKERPVAADLLLGLIRHESALKRINAEPMQAWLQIATDGCPELPDPEDAVLAYAIALSLPEAIAREWWVRLGAERAVALAKIIAGRAPLWLRVLRDPVSLPVAHERIGNAIRVDARVNLDTVPAYIAGQLLVQDLGSQQISDAAFAGAGTTVLDLCAGAGGKSLALAAMGAKVTAWDVRSHALDELDKRARKSGLDIQIAPPNGNYDVILVDAPCSGSGVLRRHPENRWKLAARSAEQRALVERCRGRAQRVVYATCSLLREENEEISGMEGTTLWPEESGSEGYYWATL